MVYGYVFHKFSKKIQETFHKKSYVIINKVGTDQINKGHSQRNQTWPIL